MSSDNFNVVQVYDTISPTTFLPVRVRRSLQFSAKEIGLSEGANNITRSLAVSDYLSKTMPPNRASLYARIASFGDRTGHRTFYTGVNFFTPEALKSQPTIDASFLCIRPSAWQAFCKSRSPFPPDHPNFQLGSAQEMLKKLKNVLRQVRVQAHWETHPRESSMATHKLALLSADEGRHLLIVEGMHIIHYEYSSTVKDGRATIASILDMLLNKHGARTIFLSDNALDILNTKHQHQ
jgi:hypothetical protein